MITMGRMAPIHRTLNRVMDVSLTILMTIGTYAPIGIFFIVCRNHVSQLRKYLVSQKVVRELA